ncbi:MAG: ABC transporter permease subunit [Nocardioidaceae bacterium]|nr:ABC transporter permease subunit [Nocardioidaceae bacterium]
MSLLRLTGRAARALVVKLGLVVALLALWQVLTVEAQNIFFPTPADIAVRMRELWFSGPAAHLFVTGGFTTDVVPSVARALAGWALGGLVGIAVGLVAGRWARAQGYVDPPVNFIRSLPKPAIVPLFLIVLGANDRMRIALIAFGCIWPVLLNTLQATRAVEPTLRDTGTAFGISLPRQFAMISLPAAAPRIAAGLRVSLGLALILMVLSEWSLTQHGLGNFLLTSQRSYQVLDMWAAVAMLGLLGYLLNLAFLALEKRLLAWHVGFTGTPLP